MGESPVRRVLLSLSTVLLGAIAAAGCSDVSLPHPIKDWGAEFAAKATDGAEKAMRRDEPAELSATTFQFETDDLRFDPESVACEPRAVSTAPGAWETSAPRERLSQDDAKPRHSAEVGLRNHQGSTRFPVTARVIAPDDTAYSVETTLTGTAWTRLSFPDDFPEGPHRLRKGAYTVIWSASGDQALLACDGFHRA
ncbi:hypothetical protein CDO52_07990 [Nocardiopsis gilva YIM 90087]|uniref:Lipoprotein n=1 Tax=Nocardiopsis gilva YIM 90087 TaxID=1235441 RepID=A0A223S3M7_9ACTN|nr:hypothetical protein [Nocardiopsis gilva]ASU82730.1 hypothetical protein CDO52_07990 [Nocardiopsis gilva YIM 90087]